MIYLRLTAKDYKPFNHLFQLSEDYLWVKQLIHSGNIVKNPEWKESNLTREMLDEGAWGTEEFHTYDIITESEAFLDLI